MPGAQPRRGFESRVAASARRGAQVPSGVPGVYRVPRSRTVTVTSDPGRPAAGMNPWIQPDDVQIFGTPIYCNAAQRNDYFDDPDVLINSNGPFVDFSPDNYPLAGYSHFGNRFTQSAVMHFDVLDGESYIYSPGVWPSGATGVEYENPGSTYLSSEPLQLRGRGFATNDATAASNGAVWGTTIREYPEAGYSFVGGVPQLPKSVSGDDPDVVTLYGASGVSHHTIGFVTTPGGGQTAIDYDFEFTQDLDSEGWVSLIHLWDGTLAGVVAVYGSGFGTYADGVAAIDLYGTGTVSGGFGPELGAWFRPSRYRFTY
jgi:hypothetical protein